MIAGLIKGDKAAEAGDQFEKHFCIGPTSLNREVYYSTLIYHTLKGLDSQLGDISYANKTGSEKEIIDFCVLPQFAHFKEILDEGIKKDPLFANSAIVKFCYSIIKDNKLFKELEEMNIPAKNSSVKARISFQLKNLKEKVWFLRGLKEKKNFTYVQGAFGDGWSFYDLINDRDFKQTYIDKAVTESANKSFKEDIDKCIELAEQGKKTASKYFERKDVELQAYYTETDNAHRVLNVNLINYNRSEPTRISDILQQEKDIKKLNIYCNKKHEIYAYQEDKKRHYEFKEGAYYEMTSTWPVKDGSGMCTMIMNVSSDGITEVLKFNGEDFVPSEKILELIKQNDELYIQGLSLCDAVIKSLEKGKAADVVPTANNNFQNESITVYQDKEPEGKSKGPDRECDADNSPPPPSINSTEVASQQMDELILNNQMLSEENIELKQEIEAGSQVINKKHHELIQENQQLQKKLETTQAEANQTIVELEKQNSDLQDRFGKEEQKNTELQTELAQKNEELAELRGKGESIYEENRKLRQELEVVNAGEEELKSELKELKKELSQVREENSNLEDKLDSLEHLNKKMDGNQEQLSEQVLDLQKKLSCSEEVTQELINKLKSAEAEKKEANQELAEAEQRIEALEKQTSELKDKLKKKEQGSKAGIDEICKKLTQLEENLKRNEEEFKSVHEEKRKLEDKLKGVNTEKKESEDKLKEFEKEIDQAAHIMKEKEQFISDLKYQMLGLENEYDALSDIIADKVLDIEGLTKKLQNSEKEKEFFRGQVEELSEETFADKQKGFNNQFYTLTGDISSEPDNVPRKKIELSRSLSFDSESDNESYVPQNPQKKKKKLLRFSSFDSEFNKSYVPQEGDNDSAYDSNEENCDNHPCSSLGSVSPIRVQARSRT